MSPQAPPKLSRATSSPQSWRLHLRAVAGAPTASSTPRQSIPIELTSPLPRRASWPRTQPRNTEPRHPRKEGAISIATSRSTKIASNEMHRPLKKISRELQPSKTSSMLRSCSSESHSHSSSIWPRGSTRSGQWGLVIITTIRTSQ